MTDYEVGLRDGFVGVSRRRDKVLVLLRQDDKLKHEDLMQLACEAVRKDFPTWDRLARTHLDKNAQEMADASVRYTLKDYRHGNIVGLSLVDQKVGRVWLLSSITDARGKKDRDEFQEVGVEGMWEDPKANAGWRFATTDESMKNFYLSREYQDTETKESTLPLLVREARTRAKSTDPYAAKIAPGKE